MFLIDPKYDRIIEWTERVICITLTLSLMCFIFGMSSADGVHSQSLSYRFAMWIVETFNALFSLEWNEVEMSKTAIDVQFFVRKGAHITEFAVLCGLVLRSVSSFRSLTICSVMVSAMGCVAFAAFDEVHQTFVPGRDGSVSDVLVDSIGIVFTTAVACWLISTGRMPIRDGHAD